jgi:tetratricopeptide (TPR) repeat protein
MFDLIFSKRILNIFPVALFFFGAQLSIACDLDLSNGRTGPWDFYDPANHQPSSAAPQGNISRVVNVHLTPAMLALKHGNTSSISNDLDYTLRAIPNHPDALNLASRLELHIKRGLARPGEKMTHDAECYFERAIVFRPNVSTTRMLYGIHLHRAAKYSDALSAYEAALNLGMSTPDLHYNTGLALYKAGRYEEAAEEAKLAYNMGFPLPGLRDYLREAGYWKD